MFRYLLLLFFINISFSAYAIDLAGQYTSENFNCLYKNGVHQSIIRAYHSYGKIDSDAKNNIFYSNKAGLATDAYMFPCRGKNATLQVSELIQYLDSLSDSSSKYSYAVGTVWLDIETNPSVGCSWNIGTKQSNCEYIKELIGAFNAKKRSVGIYASHYMWIQILGGTNECQNFTDKPIWYAHYDMKPNFDDWSSNKFGGWVKPTLKQFSDREKICGLTEDMNYF